MYSSLEIAASIITKYAAIGHPITNLKLNKILYLCQLEAIRQGYKEGIFKSEHIDDVFVAWRHGPVHHYIYDSFKRYIGFPIDPNDKIVKTYYRKFDKKIEAILSSVVRLTSKLNAWELVEILHKSPTWSYIYGKNNSLKIIPFELIQKDTLNWRKEINLKN